MNNSIGKCVETNKDQYVDKTAAEAAATYVNSKYPNQVPQYAYACEDCPYWHLSAMPPESHSLARTSWPVGTPEIADSRSEKIRQLFKEGKSFTQIAKALGVAYQRAYNVCVTSGLYTPRSQAHPVKPSKLGTSVEGLEDQERTLAAQLSEIRKKKEALIEAKQLKVDVGTDLFTIRKEGNVLQLSFADAVDLMKKVLAVHPDRAAILDMLIDFSPVQMQGQDINPEGNHSQMAS